MPVTNMICLSRKRHIALALACTTAICIGTTLQAAGAPAAASKAVFEKYCFQCHGEKGSPMGGVSLSKLAAHPVGDNFQTWQKVVTVLDQSRMPPKGMPQPTDEERHLAVSWARNEINTFANKNAGDPGRVTVRRLTSGEYGYAINDLTGLELDLGRDSANDSVGGEGFMNFGDVQFMQDANLERYLETAKLVADHAVVGAGPVQFYEHPGKTGFELSAISRIKTIYATQGFRTVSGEGGHAFGLEKYRKAFYVAWRYQHRAALGEPNATIKQLADREGSSVRFAQHIYEVMNKPSLGYPSSEVATRFRKFPADEAGARKASKELEDYVTGWPSWLFARGDEAFGGAGDESPLIFDDKSLKAEASHHFSYNAGPRGAGGRGGPMKAGSSVGVYMNIAAITQDESVKPVVVWRNAKVLVRKAGQGRGAAAPPPPVEEPVEGAPVDAAALKARALPTGPTILLKDFVSPETAAKLGFGKSPDGSEVGPNDFVTVGNTASIQLPVPEGAVGFVLQVDATVGKNHDEVVRITFSNRADGPPPGIPVHAMVGDMQSAGYRKFKAGVMELVALLPPRSNSEATPADKDPPPLPFDPTYNTPEHDAFDNNVRFQREDRFIVENILDDATRVKLDQAWNDLHSSFDYHDQYLQLLADHFKLTLKSKKMADLTAADVEAMPEEARKYVKPQRAEYLETVSAEAAARPRHVEDCIDFASKAWRRPLTEREKESLRAFYRQTMLSQQDHTKAVRALIARILIAPDFLYRVEQPIDVATAPKSLSQWELATRMSFFLWSSIPDDELRRAASAGELSNPQLMQKQVKRMLADAKARRMSAEFFGQWLGFYRFDQFKGVDTGRFPEFTDAVKSAMYDEAVSFFEYIIRNDRPNREILNADYTFMNKTLANFYGVKKEVKSVAEAEKVDGANAFERGGALRLGAVLTVTSAPLRTSPVKRGDWILRRVLNTPTPPPPADAGSIPADDKLFGGLSLHDKLEAHKRNATCANCHARIDPMGFPLEHYDSTGRWRDKYPDGKDIYDAGTTFDHVEISGANGLLSYLSSKDEQVRRTLATKLVGYALGRTVLPSDLSLIDKIVTDGGDAPFSQLVTEVISSKQFRTRLGRDDTPPAKVVPATVASSGVRNSDKAGVR
jgi:mono/diheme cytochrome c family protein